jgi:hypothetical protein
MFDPSASNKIEKGESNYYRVMDVYMCCILKSFNWNEKQDERNNNVLLSFVYVILGGDIQC